MSKREAEYERQFWGFSAEEIATGLKETMAEAIEGLVRSMHDSIQKKKGEKSEVLTKNCQILLNELADNTRETVDNFEKYILETFSLPQHVLLTEDSVQREQYTEQDREDLQKEIEQLWKQVDRVHFLELCLSKELEKHKQIECIAQKLKTLDLPPIDSLPSPKNLHNLVLDTLGLEVDEAACHLQTEEEIDRDDTCDSRSNKIV